MQKFVTKNVAVGRASYEHFGVSLPFTIPPVLTVISQHGLVPETY
jgi:hypothetical protein